MLKVYIDRGRAARQEPAIVVEYGDGSKEYCRRIVATDVNFTLVQSNDLTAKPHIWLEVGDDSDHGMLIMTGQQ